MRKIFAGLGILSLILALAAPVLAQVTEPITVTVTPRLISVSVSPTTVGYGVVDVPSTDNEPTTPSADPIIAVNNDGNAAEDFDIKGADATGTTTTWTIVDGAPGGADTYNYNHKFLDCGSDNTCGSPAGANNMTTAYETLEASVAAGNTEYFQLRLNTPTETGGDTSQHTTSVTIRATAS